MLLKLIMMKNSVYFIFIFLNFCTSQEYKINGISFVASDKIVSEDDVNAILKMNANWVTLMGCTTNFPF